MTYTVPSTYYGAWSTTTPNDDGSNFAEPTTGGYARVAITNSSANFTTVDNVPSGTTAWVASTAHSLNDTVRPTALSTTGYYYVCTTAGTSGSTAPTWSTTVGNTVTDGTVVWTTHAAQGSATTNATTISFPQSNAAEGGGVAPQAFALYDSATVGAGTMWDWSPMTGASAVPTNETLDIPAYSLTLFNH